jgi:Rieske Fe-S protein
MSEEPETTSTPPASDHPEVGRRTVLRAAGVGGVGAAAAALAACSGSSTPPTSGAAASSSTSSGSTAGSGSSGSGGAGPSGTPVKTADVPVGGGVINASALFVVTQPTAGQFKAFSATCTHQGCTVTKVVDGMIDCPCHGSQFDITTGAPTSSSQARSPLPPKTATVSGDSVFIA